MKLLSCSGSLGFLKIRIAIIVLLLYDLKNEINYLIHNLKKIKSASFTNRKNWTKIKKPF